MLPQGPGTRRGIADVWAEVLDLDEVGIHDNFFDLGGDSLLAAKLVLQVQHELQHMGPWETILQTATVACMASVLEQASGATVAGSMPVPAERAPQESKPLPEPLAVAPPAPAAYRKAPNKGGRRAGSSLAWRMLVAGPVVKGHALPYGVGVRLQRMWLRLPGIRPRLIQRATVFRRWLNIAGVADPDGALLERNLMANTWEPWRNRALCQPGAAGTWIRLIGRQHLDHALSQQRGIVLVTLHLAMSVLSTRLALQMCGAAEPYFIAGSDGKDLSVASRFLYGRQLLEHGGVVIIMGDGEQGKGGLPVSFLGRSFTIKPGAAELAVGARAQFIPAFTSMAGDGRITVEFTEPLATLASPPDAQIQSLIRQYADLLLARWPAAMLPDMKWEILRKLQQLPAA